MSEDERLKDCEYCNSINCMIRIPTNFVTEVKTNDNTVGNVVKKAIEEYGQELQEEKQKLANKTYNELD
tara:strand:- start:364 stop:570 length:207 start_codon:yes stop_codon:yes gene_type:complete